MIIGSQAHDLGLTRRDQRNLKPLKLYAAIWLASFLFAHLVLPPGAGGTSDIPAWVWPVLAVPIVAGVLLAHAYFRFIQGADELLRKIHIEALATGFGAAFVFGMGADLLDQARVPEIASLTWAVMVVVYVFKLRQSRKAYSE